MNNRFKFRFWCSSENRFITDCVIHGDGKISVKTGICGRDYCHDVVIQQYTGLTDSKDKEIYEGDILWHKNENLMVSIMWKNSGFIFVNKNHPENGHYIDKQHAKEMSITGNIFEHPELLK